MNFRPGEYVITRGASTEAERADAKSTLRRQGCRCVRFEELEDGRMQVHGYLSYITGEGVEPA